MQNEDGLDRAVHHLVHRAFVEYPVHDIMMSLHNTENIRMVTDHKIHDPLYRIGFLNVHEVQARCVD